VTNGGSFVTKKLLKNLQKKSMTKTSLFIVIVPSYYIQTTHLKGFPKIKKWKCPKKHFCKKNQKTEKNTKLK